MNIILDVPFIGCNCI